MYQETDTAFVAVTNEIRRPDQSPTQVLRMWKAIVGDDVSEETEEEFQKMIETAESLVEKGYSNRPGSTIGKRALKRSRQAEDGLPHLLLEQCGSGACHFQDRCLG